MEIVEFTHEVSQPTSFEKTNDQHINKQVYLSSEENLHHCWTNGAGKTTLSFTILPEIFNCDEFVNADEIARGLSPLNPSKAGIRAGRLMLERIQDLFIRNETFAFETTLSTRSYKSLVLEARKAGFEVILLFLVLDSVELAKKRVATRVKEGGHDIPEKVIERRFENGLKNFFNIYLSIVNKWIIVDNSSENFEFIAEGTQSGVLVKNESKWNQLKNEYHGKS